VNIYDYFTFGMGIKDREWSNSSFGYRFGFNGQEGDDEINGDGNSYAFKYRIHDPRLGRFFSVDPLAAKAPGWSPYRAFFCNPIRYTDPDGRWEWDATGNLVAQKGDQSYSLAKFLGTNQKNAMQMLNRGGVTANAKGILNLKEGQSFAKNDLWVGTKSGSGPVVNNTKEATSHYFNGNGASADVGDQTTSELLGSSEFQTKHSKITSQIVQAKGDFSVKMKNLTFHMGSTGVDYNVGGNGSSSSVTYTLFTHDVYVTDGFWDPDVIDENTLGRIPYVRDWTNTKPDGPGSNLERFGGTPYHYKMRERTFFFKPVE
jgi:RHS repeat-associated protein